MLPTRDSLLGERHTDWKWGDGERFHANRNNKKAEIAILISDKIDLKAIKKTKKDIIQ